jgi:hypothetical protein
MIGRQVGSGSVVCRLIVFTTVLFTSGVAMAEDNNVVTGTPASLFSYTSSTRNGAGKFELFALEPRVPKPEDLPVGGQSQLLSDRSAESGVRTSVYSDPSPTLRLIVGYNF